MSDYIEIDSDLLILAANNTDYDRKEIAERLSSMSIEERRTLRQAISTLDELIDAVALESHNRRR